MLIAVSAGKALGAEIGFIDKAAINILDEVWAEMSFWERRRYSWSMFVDRRRGKEEGGDDRCGIRTGQRRHDRGHAEEVPDPGEEAHR
ncbi:MAG: hypothetical protein ACOX10_04415 [Candidatus Methanomethylophilaceae archaeon]